MIYLSGVTRPELLTKPHLGVIVTPEHGFRPTVLRIAANWAADNACYSQGESFRLDRFLSWLAKHDPYLERCRFVVAPDVVGDAVASVERSVPVLPIIRRMGYPVALAAQNGAESIDLPWDDFDVLFLGGIKAVDPSDGKEREWKVSTAARTIVAEAKRRGKWVHMGRVNSYRRLRTAQLMACDSADGTFLVRAPAFNVPRLNRWYDELQRQPPLFVGEGHPA